MKTLFTFLAVAISTVCFCQEPFSPLSAEQILRMVIQRYDPDQRWDSYRGEIHLSTIRPKGGSSEEDIVLDNRRSFYQSTLFSNGDIIERKIDGAEISFTVNGRSELTEAEQTAYGLSRESLQQICQHHRVHFGLPMYLRKMGIELAPEATKGRFNDVECWVLTFRGDPKEKAGSYFKYPIRLYINSDNYDMVGMMYDNQGGDFPAAYVIFSDEIEVGGIRIPKIKTYYLAKDDTYWFTDVFYPYTRGTYTGEEAEKEAIRQLLDEETRYFYVRDYENWAHCWSHQEDVFFSYTSKIDYTIKKGWEALSEHMRQFMQDNPDPHLPPIERNDYVFYLQGDLAWVYFNNKEGEQTAGLHQRVVRKENSVWKLVNMTGIDEGSYRER